MKIYSDINKGLSYFPHKLFMLENSHLIKKSSPHDIIHDRYEDSRPLSFIETLLLEDSPKDVSRYSSTMDDIKEVYTSYRRLAQALSNNDFDLLKPTDIFRTPSSISSYFKNNSNSKFDEYNNLGIHISDFSTLDVLFSKNDKVGIALNHHIQKITNKTDYSFINSNEYKEIALNSIEHIITSCNDSILDLYNNESLFFNQYDPRNTLINITRKPTAIELEETEKPIILNPQYISLAKLIILQKTSEHIHSKTFEKLNDFLEKTNPSINWFEPIDLSNTSNLHNQSKLDNLNYHTYQLQPEIDADASDDEKNKYNILNNIEQKKLHTGPFINSVLSNTNSTNLLLNVLIKYIDEDVLFEHLENINFLHFISGKDSNFYKSDMEDRVSVLADLKLNKIKEDIHGLTPLMYARYDNVVEFLTKDNLSLYTPTSKNEYPIAYLLKNLYHENDFIDILKKFEYKKISASPLSDDIKNNIHLQLTAVLAKAIELKNFGVFETALKIAKKHPNFNINTQDIDGNTLLMKASYSHKYDTMKIARLILEQDGVDYNLQNNSFQDAFAIFSQNHKSISTGGDTVYARHEAIHDLVGRKIWDNTDITKKYSSSGEKTFIDNVIYSHTHPKFDIPHDHFNQTEIRGYSDDTTLFLCINALFETVKKQNPTLSDKELISKSFFNSHNECFLNDIIPSIKNETFSTLHTNMIGYIADEHYPVLNNIWQNMPRSQQINFMAELLSEQSLDSLEKKFTKEYRLKPAQEILIDNINKLVEIIKPTQEEHRTIFKQNTLATHTIFKIENEASPAFSKFEALLLKTVCAIRETQEPKKMRI